MDALNKAIEAAGGVSRLAGLIGEAQNTVSNWRARGVPIAPCARIERATGVMRWHLRPHDWHDIWPELAMRPDAPARVDVAPAQCAGSECIDRAAA
jgi:DNA-binding transcriptional regulator YdaS (Cro superfamily)